MTRRCGQLLRHYQKIWRVKKLAF